MNLPQLYKPIPTFPCIPGCHDCCGRVPFLPEEWKKLSPKELKRAEFCQEVIAGFGQLIGKQPHCPFVSEKGCTIYHNRPFYCRLFGTTKALKCPHGRQPKKLLSDQMSNKLTTEYAKQSAAKGIHSCF